jgi:hypothetical protein
MKIWKKESSCKSTIEDGREVVEKTDREVVE